MENTRNSKTLLRTYRPFANKKYRNSKKLQYTNLECGNCGQHGHIYKYCKKPTISCGIIAVQPFSDKSVSAFKIKELEELSEKSDIRFLLIRRKDTIAFVDFIRGKYNYNTMDDIEYLKKQMSAMTPYERKNIMINTFDYLWNNLWSGHNISFYGKDYTRAKSRYDVLKKGFSINGESYNLEKIINNTNSSRQTPAWGFPKGRRNMGESDMCCAIREFIEETGYRTDNYILMTDCPPVIESYTGSNGNEYEHRYYLATFNKKIKRPYINKQDHKQAGEIGNIAWVTYDEAKVLLSDGNEPSHKLQLLFEIRKYVQDAIDNHE